MNWMHLEEDRSYLLIEGRWRRLGNSRSVLVPDMNHVRVECYRRERVCIEHIAKLITPDDDDTGLATTKSLFVMKETFQIGEWTEDTISARATPRAADLNLRISLRDGVAERSARWTPARGAEVSDPSVTYNWVLRTLRPPNSP
jgi:hypothetical protein